MDIETAMGAQVKSSNARMHECTNAGSWTARRVRTVCICAFLHLCISSLAFADHYAVVVTGASGGDQYAQKYDTWRASFVNTLREKLRFDDAHLFVLAERESAGVLAATRENVQRVLGELRRRMAKDDLLFVVLIGHGTAVDGDDAKFNLVGPDLSATEWAELLKPIPGRLAFVDTTGASFPFMRKLAGRGRVILTATDSAAQQFETVFPDYFVKAFDDPAADLDRNGRVSLWEAFSYASAGVRTWFEQHGQLPTERPLLDDSGDGVGRESQNPGPDGATAKVMYLDSDAVAASTGDTTRDALLKRRADLESQIEALKARKPTMAVEQFEAELERLLIELARVSVQLRTKT
jgi:hypothetical protein